MCGARSRSATTGPRQSARTRAGAEPASAASLPTPASNSATSWRREHRRIGGEQRRRAGQRAVGRTAFDIEVVRQLRRVTQQLVRLGRTARSVLVATRLGIRLDEPRVVGAARMRSSSAAGCSGGTSSPGNGRRRRRRSAAPRRRSARPSDGSEIWNARKPGVVGDLMRSTTARRQPDHPDHRDQAADPRLLLERRRPPGGTAGVSTA